MKMNFSTIALGLALVCSSTAAYAQGVATINQSGISNQAYTEQSSLGTDISATTTQQGNHNLAGDPIAKTGGIVQISSASAYARISQTGDYNAASIYQNGIHRGGAEITQVGSHNLAAERSDTEGESQLVLFQHGDNNFMDVKHNALAYSLEARQFGTGNRLSLEQPISGFGGVKVDQTGITNNVAISQDNLLYSFLTVQQNGTSNLAAIKQKDDRSNQSIILQTGTGNKATLDESGRQNVSRITQNGDNNTATSTQRLISSESTITQTGNDNLATVTQTGIANGFTTPNTAYITQVGNGFIASIAQAGIDNHAGIYQH